MKRGRPSRAEVAAKRVQEARRERAVSLIGHRFPNAGKGLALGEEWDTTDGCLVRQVEVSANPHEAGHFYGWLEVLGPAA